MYSSYGSGGRHQSSFYPPGSSNYQPQQQYPGGYQYTHGYQSLRPPPINTGFPSSGFPMNRTSSFSSSDSGYATYSPSVASPIPQQSYPIQSSAVQSYAVSNYGFSGQPSQQSARYPYDDQRSPDIELSYAPAVPSSKHKKDRRRSTPSPASPSEYPCLYPNCGHISSRAHDLKRHMTVHFPPAVDELLDCKYEWCGRTGAHGFKREDHRKEHYRKVHMKENEYPKTGKGGRSGKVSGRSTRD